MATIAWETTGLEGTVRSAASGDEVAFARLVAEHHAAMARVAFVVCGDREMARDVVQSAWTIAWRRMGSVRDPAHVRGWLVAIAANEARQVIRRDRRVQVVDISAVIDRDAGGDPGSTVAVVDLRQALRGLRPDERVLLGMRYAADLESPEIARHLGLSASGVRSRLARLIDRLRAELDLESETEQ